MPKNFSKLHAWETPWGYPVKIKIYLEPYNILEPYNNIIMVRLRISYALNIYFVTLCHITPDAWDSKFRCFTPGSVTTTGERTQKYEDRLVMIHDKILSFMENLPEGAVADFDTLRNIVNRCLGRKVKITPLSADYNRYIIERASTRKWHDNTILRERYIAGYFIEYAAKYEYASYTPAFIKGFADHLLKLKSKSNVQNMIRRVNAFLKWSKRHGKPVPLEQYTVSMKNQHRTVVYLNQYDLRRLVSLEIPDETIEVTLYDMRGFPYKKKVTGRESMLLVRDFLLFSSLTGLRYSELQDLKANNVSKNQITIIAKKTDKKRLIELNRYSKRIIKKYLGDRKSGYIFPRLSNQKANRHIKDLAEICEINEPVTKLSLIDGQKIETVNPKYELVSTHTGRKTFVCSSLLAGIPPELVILWTGHTEIDDLKPYMTVTMDSKHEYMKKIFDNINSGLSCL